MFGSVDFVLGGVEFDFCHLICIYEITSECQVVALVSLRLCAHIGTDRTGTEMAGSSAKSINNRLSFQTWLERFPNSKRSQISTLIACRAALRAVPLLGRRGSLSHQNYSTLLKCTFSWFVASRSVAKIDTFELHAIESFLHDHSQPSKAISQANGARVIGQVAAAADYAFGGSMQYGQVGDAVLRASAISTTQKESENYFSAFRDDIQRLEQSDSHEMLWDLPLWHRTPSKTWVKEYIWFSEKMRSKKLKEDGWSIWLDWYEPMISGGDCRGSD